MKLIHFKVFERGNINVRTGEVYEWDIASKIYLLKYSKNLIIRKNYYKDILLMHHHIDNFGDSIGDCNNFELY